MSPGNSSVALMPSGLGLPDKSYYYLPQKSHMVLSYQQLISDIVLQLSAPKTLAGTFGENMFFYEKRIAEVTPDSYESLNPTATYNPIKLSSLADLAPILPLQDIVTLMYPNANVDEVIVTHPDYFSKISQIISSTDRTMMNGYLMWTLVREFLPYLSTQYTAAIDAFRAEFYGIQKPLQRWEFCANLVHKFMPEAIEYLISNEESNKGREGTERVVNDIFGNLKMAVKNRLKIYEANYHDMFLHLDKKISSLQLQIGLPEKIRDSSYLKNYYNKLNILKANLFDSYKNGVSFVKKLENERLTESNEHDYLIRHNSLSSIYVPSKNAVVVPGALLLAPDFENKYPKSVLYGRLGVDIALSIISSVLPYDSAWTANMKLLTSFHLAVNDSMRIIKHPSYCLLDFINSHRLVAEDEKANLTVLNTFKYLSAVNIAHDALKEAIKNDPHVHQPSLEIYEDSALFYIAQVQSLCTLTTRQQELYDNIVSFKLSETSLLETIWNQDPFVREALSCKKPSKRQCDTF